MSSKCVQNRRTIDAAQVVSRRNESLGYRKNNNVERVSSAPARCPSRHPLMQRDPHARANISLS